MSWSEDITSSIKYIEGHGFSIFCGITVSEYIRNRRLSLAGRDLQIDGVKVVDVAMKYGYDSPDSFAKTFTRNLFR